MRQKGNDFWSHWQDRDTMNHKLISGFIFWYNFHLRILVLFFSDVTEIIKVTSTTFLHSCVSFAKKHNLRLVVKGTGKTFIRF